jgi:hypothetical protein
MGIIDPADIERLKSDLAARRMRSESLIAGSYLADMVRRGHCSADVFGGQRSFAASAIGECRAA